MYVVVCVYQYDFMTAFIQFLKAPFLQWFSVDGKISSFLQYCMQLSYLQVGLYMCRWASLSLFPSWILNIWGDVYMLISCVIQIRSFICFWPNFKIQAFKNLSLFHLSISFSSSLLNGFIMYVCSINPWPWPTDSQHTLPHNVDAYLCSIHQKQNSQQSQRSSTIHLNLQPTKA